MTITWAVLENGSRVDITGWDCRPFCIMTQWGWKEVVDFKVEEISDEATEPYGV